MPETPLVPTSARRLRAKKDGFIFRVDDTLVVKMKKLDFASLFMNGLIPQPILSAVHKFKELAEKAENAQNGLEMLEIMRDQQQDNKGFLEVMRRYVCACVIEPIFVLDDNDEDPDHAPVSVLSTTQLLAIWGAEPQEEPLVTPEAAEEFRREEPPAPAHDVSDGGEVRPETKLLDFTDREAISG